MADDNKNNDDNPLDPFSDDTEQGMDETRMIEIPPKTFSEVTKTKIGALPVKSAQIPDDDVTPVEPIQTSQEKGNFFTKLSRRYRGWFPPPNGTLVHKIFFIFSRLILLGVGGFFIYCLTQVALLMLPSTLISKWIVLGVVALGGLLALSVLVFGIHPSWFAGGPLLAFLSILGLQVFLEQWPLLPFQNIIGGWFSITGNFFWICFGVLQLLLVCFVYPRSLILKILLSLIPLYGVIALVYAQFFKIPLEMTWFGFLLFEKIPWYVQPSFLLVQGWPFFFALFSLFYLIFGRKTGKGSWVLQHLLLLLIVGNMGSLLCFHNRLPGPLTFLLKQPIQIGTVSRQEKGNLIQIQVGPFEEGKYRDDWNRYDLELISTRLKSEGKTSDPPKKPDEKSDKVSQQEILAYSLYVQKDGGVPVYRLHESDMKLWFNGQEILDWSLEEKITPSAAPSSRFAFYQISFKKPNIKPLEIMAPKEDSVEMKKKIPATPKGVYWDSPQEGDAFDSQVALLVSLEGIDAEEVASISVSLDDHEVLHQNIFDAPPWIIPTSDVGLGVHSFLMKITDAAGKIIFEKKVSLYKRSFIPIALTSPMVGSYVGRSTLVDLDMPMEATSLYSKGVQVLVDGRPLQTIAAPPFAWTWDKADLGAGSHLITVLASGEEGVQTSVSTRVYAGEGTLRFDGMKNIGVFPGKTVLILDASTSMQDDWLDKSKWESLRRLITSRGVLSGLKKSDMGVVLTSTGNENCESAEWLLPVTPQADKKMDFTLRKIKPRGFSSLWNAFEKAIGENPQRVILFADGGDSCQVDISEKVTAALKEKKILLDIILLGEVAPSVIDQFQKLATLVGGQVLVEKDIKVLEKKLEGLLNPHYQVFAGERMLFEGNLSEDSLSLLPGDYFFQISSQPDLKIPFTITHGQETKLGGE